MSTPILLLSDCPSQHSGLSRITRDLGTLLASMPEFRVASLGLMGVGDSRLPFHTYHLHSVEFGELSLPGVWDEWSQGEPGIVMTIFDLSRVLWLARPEFAEDEGLREWLTDARRRKFKLWGYVPVDATGPGNRLTAMSRDCLLGMDRLLAYSPWAEGVIRNTIGSEAADARGLTWMPHGLNTRTFAPMPTLTNVTNVTNVTHAAADGLSSQPGGGDTHVPCIGVVMTNQMRKDWALAAVVCAGLMERLKGRVRLWWHVDLPVRSWNMHALIADYHLGEYVELTTPPASDQWMAEQYRRCDLTLLPSLGEGFGLPIFESLECGVPCIHGDYAGGASIMSSCGLADLLVGPVQWRMEGQHNCVRPVFDPQDWVSMAMTVLNEKWRQQFLPQPLQSYVEHLSWMKLGHIWKRWFKEGLGE